MIKHQVCQKSSKAINKSFDDWRVFNFCSMTTPSSVGYFIEYFFVFEQCVCWLRKLSTHSIGIVFVYFVRPAEVVLKKCKKKPFSRELYGRCLSKILGIFASFWTPTFLKLACLSTQLSSWCNSVGNMFWHDDNKNTKNAKNSRKYYKKLNESPWWVLYSKLLGCWNLRMA